MESGFHSTEIMREEHCNCKERGWGQQKPAKIKSLPLVSKFTSDT